MIKTDKSVPKPFFSIVIPTLNEEKFLPGLLKDLRKQTFKEFEVIHVDGDSVDLTCAKASEFAKDISITTLSVNKRNVSHQRNTGSRRAKGEWVIFMDADNRIKRSFLAKLHDRIIDQPEIDIFSCLIDNSHTSKIMKNLLDITNLIMVASAKVRPFAAGAMIGIKRIHLKELEFDCEAKLSEDHQFVREAVKNGLTYKVFSQPRYAFSMRRFEKEGALKMIVVYVQGGAVMLAGPRFEKYLPIYPMNGGSDYDVEKGISGLLPSMRDIISVTTKSQQQKMKTIFSRLQQLMNDI